MLFCIDRYPSPVNILLFSSFNIVNSYFNIIIVRYNYLYLHMLVTS